MGFYAMFTIQLDNTKRQTLPVPHYHNGSCRYVQAQFSFSTAQGYLATEVSQLWDYLFGKWLRHECQICRCSEIFGYTNKYTLSLYQTFLIPICKSSISSILLEHESRLNCCQSGVEDHSIKGCAAFVWMQFSSPQKELNSRFQMQRSFKL